MSARTVIEGCAIATVDDDRREFADGHLVLEDGRIAARGTHAELLERSPLYAEIAEKGLPDQVFLNRMPREAVAGL